MGFSSETAKTIGRRSVSCRRGLGVALSLAMAWLAVGSPAFGDPPPSKRNRLPGQSHNRMVFIKHEGKKPIYFNMPGHFELGSPCISPDGRWIVFDAMTIGLKPVRETWLLGVDGKGLKKLVDGATPRWSPDGKRILYTRIVKGKPGSETPEKQTVVEFDLASGKSRDIVEGRFGDLSPDGKQLVFAREGEVTANSGVHPGSKLFLAPASGKDPVELVDGDWPSWSPNGKMIAYCACEEDTLPQMNVMDVEEKKSESIGVGFYRAAWAPDGKSVYCNGLVAGPKRENLNRLPVRLWLNKSKMDFFLMDLDVPFSPHVSRDGKTMVLIVDSEGPARSLEELQEQDEEEKLELEPPINPGG